MKNHYKKQFKARQLIYLIFLFLTTIGANSEAQTCVGVGAGTYSIGPTGTYSSITSALTAVNAGITGPVVLELQSTYTSLVETFPITFPVNTCITSVNTLTIRPESGATSLSISSSDPTGTIIFNGAANITIDGRAGGVGASQLSIANTNIGASFAVQFAGDANANSLQYSTILSANTSATSGSIVFGQGLVIGNDNNTITQCSIKDGVSNPVNAIYSAGASALIDNSGNIISDNNISNYFSAGQVSNGIFLTSTGNSAWTITNNRLFQTSTRVFNAANTHIGINIQSGSGYTISGNIIGFANSSGTGTTNLFGNTGVVSGTFPDSYTVATGTAVFLKYIAINCAFSPAGAVSEIQGNTVGGFALYSAGGTGGSTINGLWCGINITAGNVNVGTSSGNTIGATSGTSSIYSACNTTGGTVVGIYSTSANTVNIQNNTVGSIDAVGTSATVTGGFTGIDCAGAGSYTIANNTIGGSTTDNIRTGYTLSGGNLSNVGVLTSSTGATSAMIGIRNTSTGNLVSVIGNTLRGWVTSGTAIGVTGIIGSGTMTGSLPSSVFNGNFLGTPSLAWMRFGVASSANLTGVALFKIGANTTSIQNNDIRGILYTVAGSGQNIYINCTGATASGNTATIANNTFTNLNINTIGSITFIQHNYSVASTGTQNINNNSIVTGFNKASAGGIVTGILSTPPTSASGAICNHTNNNFSNITVTGANSVTGINNNDGGVNGVVRTVTGNIFSNWSGGSGAFTGISYNHFGGASSVSNNTISNLSNQGAITGINLGAASNLANPLNVTNNTISGLISTGTGGAVLGLASANTSPIINISANIISALSSTANAVTGLSINGGSIVNNSGNLIANLSSSNASGVVKGITVASGTSVTISSDTIHSLSASGATSPLVTGIEVVGGATINVLKNKIYNLSVSAALTTTAGAVKGIGLSGGTTVNVYNNLIGDLKAPAAGLTDAIRGISVTSTAVLTNYNLYFNTIYLNASSSNTSFGTSGIYHTANSTATTAQLDLRNNIVINVSSPGSIQGKSSALFRTPAGTLGNYSTNSNRNLYYAGVPGNANVILNDNGTGYGTAASGFAFGPSATVGSFQNQVTAARESNSFTDAVFSFSTPGAFFQSLSGSSTNFLHLVTGIVTAVEGGASVISSPSITDDYDGDIRDLLKPDVGADEFAGLSAIPVISNVTSNVPLTTQCSATNRIISADVTTPVGTINTVTLNYSYNGTPQTPVSMSFVSGDTWTGTIVAPVSPSNALVSWSITAVSSISTSNMYIGTSYQDGSASGITATAVASVSPVCSGSPTSLSIALSTATIPPAPAAASYCASTHANGCLGDDIVQVVLNTINNATPGCGGASHYTYFNGGGTQTTTLTANAPSYSLSLTFGTDGNQYFGAWIDNNHDGTYDVTEFLGASGNAGSGGTIAISFTVPSSAYNGLTHLRIIGGNDSPVSADQACGASSSSFGETQDYDVTIIGGLNAVPYTGTITAYSWSDGTNVVGNTNPLVQNPTTNTTYTGSATAEGCPVIASVIVNVIALPAAPVATNSTQCGTQVPTCSVAGLGGVYKWYDAITGGTLIQNGSTTYSGVISITDTFYVSEFNGTCESARTMVIANVFPPDSVVASSSVANICPFNNFTLTATQTSFSNGNTYTYAWTASPVQGSGISANLPGNPVVIQATAGGSFIYTVTATDGACITTSSVVVSITTPPNIDSIKATPSSVCLGLPVELNVYSSGLGSGSQNQPTGYCSTSGFFSNNADEQIFAVSFGAMSNNQVETCSSNYTDYTSTIAAPTVTAGDAVPFSVSQNECDQGTLFNNGLSIYIDFNRDGDFDDIGENAYTSNGTSASTGPSPAGDNVRTGFITIPLSALAGVTRMRVVCEEGNPSPSACTNTLNYGEAEDYIINVIGVAIQDPAKTYSWSPVGGNSASATVTPVDTTIYTVTVNAIGNICTNYGSVTVKTLPIPLAPIATNSSQQCSGVPTCSVAGAGGVFKWYDAASGGNLLQTGDTTYLGTISITTTFYVSETSIPDGCEGPRVAVVATVLADVVTASTNDITPCIGSSVQLNSVQIGSSNNYVFTWTASPSAGSGISIDTIGQNVLITPTISGTYIYTVNAFDTVAQCGVFSTVTVTVSEFPVISSLTASADTNCIGNADTLTAISAGTNAYLWNPGAITSNTAIVNPIATTTYSITVTNIASGCATTDSISIVVLSVPLVPAVSPLSVSVCNISVTTLTAVLNDPINNTIRWFDDSIGGNLLGTGVNFETPVISDTTVFYAEEYNGTCASPRVGATIYWLPAPSITVTTTATDPCVTGTVNAELNVSSGNDPNYVYSWEPVDSLSAYTGGGFAITNINATTVFTVTAIDATAGCTITEEAVVTIFKFPVFNASASEDTICPGTSTNLSTGVSSTPFLASSIPYAVSPTPISPTILATGGADVVPRTSGTLDDGGWAGIPIGFNFNFFGNSYTSVNIGTNGVLQFGAYNASEIAQFSFTNGIPSDLTPLNIIAAMACDLYLVNGGTLSYWTEGVAPSRIFVVEYLNIPGFTANGNQNVQAILHETTGVVDIQVTEATTTAAKTIGVQDATLPTPVGSTAPGRNAFNGSIGAEGWRFQPPVVYTFLWTPNNGTLDDSTLSNPIATPITTTEYFVLITDPVTLCQKTDSVLVVVNPVPAIPTIADTSICGPKSIDLTANGGGPVYRWYLDSITNTILSTNNPFATPIISNDTSYFVSSFDLCESARKKVAIDFSPSPAFEVTSSNYGKVCAGDSVTLSVSTGVSSYESFSWSPSTGLSSASGSTVNAAPGSTQVYTVTASNSTGLMCANIDTVIVNVNGLPLITSLTANPAVLCQGDSTQLNVVANTFISSVNYALSPIPFTPVIPTGTVTVLADAGVAVTPLSGFGDLDDGTWDNIALPSGFAFNYFGSAQSTFSVSTNGFMTFGASGGADCCSGQFIPDANSPNSYLALAHEDWTLSVSGTIDYFTNGTAPNRKFVVRFTNAPRFLGASGPTTGQIVLNENANTIEYHVTSANTALGDETTMGIENSTGTSATVVAGRNSTSPWTATNEGWLFNPPVANSLVYSWSPISDLSNSNISNPMAAPVISTDYIIEVAESATGCINSDTISVLVSAVPKPKIVPGDTTLCQGSSYYLYVVDTGAYSGGYPAGTTIDWVGIIDGLSPSDSVNTTGISDFSVIVHLPDSLGGCDSDTSDIVHISTHQLDIIPDITNATCGSNNGKIIINVVGTAPFHYIWTDGINVIHDVQTSNTIDSIVGLAGGIYYLNVIDNEGNVNPGLSCNSGQLSFFVPSDGGPNAFISSVSDITCNGSSDGSATASQSGGIGAIIYQWLPYGGTATTSDPLGAGTFTVLVTDANGCVDTAEVTISEPAILISNASTINATCDSSDGAGVVIVQGGRSPYTYNWYDDNFIDLLVNNDTITGLAAATYYVVVTDSAGYCFTIDTIEVSQTCEVALNLSAFIEGYYIGGGAMQPVMSNAAAAIGNTYPNFTDCDTITVELHDQLNPAVIVPGGVSQAMLQVDGTAEVLYPGTIQGGSYWIVVKNRTMVETWSSQPVTFTGLATSYNFTTIDTMAYSSNMREIEPGYWVMYSGDIDDGSFTPFQDGFVDIFDYLIMDVDIQSGNAGYYVTDLNGDGFIDIFDFLVLDPNIQTGVSKLTPP